MKRKLQFKWFLFLLPSLAGILLFYLIPFGQVVSYSFQKTTADGSFAGFQNYKEVLNSGAFQKAFGNTMIVSFIGTFFAILISFSIALLVYNSKRRMRVVKASAVLPLMIPSAATVLLIRFVFGESGFISRLSTVVTGYPMDVFRTEGGLIVAVLLFLWKYTGYFMLLFLGGLLTVPKEEIEAAKMDGASMLRIVFSVIIPHISPSIFFIFLLAFMNSFRVFREIYLSFGDYPYDSIYLISHYLNNSLHHLSYQKMSAAAILIALVVILISVILWVAERHAGKDMES